MKNLLYILTILLLSKVTSAQDTSFYFKTSDGVRLYVRTVGEGRPCLFLHGGPGLTSYYFEALPVAKLIEQKVHMIYFDQRGGGRSSSPKDGNYSMKRMEQDIEEIRNFLKIKKWSVMGHSFGGLIMTAYAKDYPQSIRSLIYAHCMIDIKPALASHINNGLKLLEQVGDTIHLNKQLPAFGQMNEVDSALTKKGIGYKIMFSSLRDEKIDDSLTKAATPHFNQDFNHYVWSTKDYWTDYTKYTKDILCPVLIITGTKDYAVGPETYKSWHFKNEKIVFFDAAHFSFLDEPKRFAETVLQFLKS